MTIGTYFIFKITIYYLARFEIQQYFIS